MKVSTLGYCVKLVFAGNSELSTYSTSACTFKYGSAAICNSKSILNYYFSMLPKATKLLYELWFISLL